MAKSLSIPALILVTLGSLPACAMSKEAPASSEGATAAAPIASAKAPDVQADGKQAGIPKTSRKVIRNAELSIEVKSPAAAESKVSALVESLGGYVASSERQVSADEGERATARVNLSLRVPADRLEQALRDIKRLGSGAETEKIGSEDVTDEYIDVEARIINQRRLEQQLAGILTQATKVDETLRVHQELTNVRTEIDRLEGRKRFLETESSLAKIALSIAPIPPVVAANSTGFGVSVRRAATDSVTVASNIVTFAIRATGVLLPLAVMLGMPTLALAWWLRRRQRRLTATLSA